MLSLKLLIKSSILNLGANHQTFTFHKVNVSTLGLKETVVIHFTETANNLEEIPHYVAFLLGLSLFLKVYI